MAAIAHPMPTPITFQRRRLAVLVLACALLVFVVALAGPAFARREAVATVTVGAAPGAGPARPAEATPDAAPIAYVVRPGDTVWSIAESLDPDGDVRAVVDRIVAANGGATLVPGQRILLDD